MKDEPRSFFKQKWMRSCTSHCTFQEASQVKDRVMEVDHVPRSSVEPRWTRLHSWHWSAGATPSLILVQVYGAQSGATKPQQVHHTSSSHVNKQEEDFIWNTHDCLVQKHNLLTHLVLCAAARRWKVSANWLPGYQSCSSSRLITDRFRSLGEVPARAAPPTSKLQKFQRWSETEWSPRGGCARASGGLVLHLHEHRVEITLKHWAAVRSL